MKQPKPTSLAAAKKAHAARTRRALEQHVEYLRKQNQGRPTQYYVMAAELADETGADVTAIIEEFDHRAAVREYLGETTRAEAERLAWGDVEQRFRTQERMAV